MSISRSFFFSCLWTPLMLTQQARNRGLDVPVGCLQGTPRHRICEPHGRYLIHKLLLHRWRYSWSSSRSLLEARCGSRRLLDEMCYVRKFCSTDAAMLLCEVQSNLLRIITPVPRNGQAASVCDLNREVEVLWSARAVLAALLHGLHHKRHDVASHKKFSCCPCWLMRTRACVTPIQLVLPANIPSKAAQNVDRKQDLRTETIAPDESLCNGFRFFAPIPR